MALDYQHILILMIYKKNAPAGQIFRGVDKAAAELKAMF